MIKIIHFFLIFGLVSATSIVSEIETLAADVQLNIHLIRNIRKEGFVYNEELKGFNSSLEKFYNALIQPKILRMFCGLLSDNDDLKTKLLNKFQIDNWNPFAEFVTLNSLDRSKFSRPLPEKFSAGNMEKFCDSGLLKEFEDFAEYANEPMFKPKFDKNKIHKYRVYIKERLKKVMKKRIELYAAEKNIIFPHKNFDEMIKIYIASENSLVMAQEEPENPK